MDPVDTKFDRSPTSETVISANNLNSSDTLIDIPDFPKAPEIETSGGALETFAAQEKASIAEQKAKTDAQAIAADTAFSDYVKSLSSEESVDALQFRAENQAGVPQLEADLNRLNNQLLGEQQALKKRIDKLQANAEGGLATGIEGEIRNAQRESYSIQADIAIVQMAAQGRFDSAIKWAQRKAAIEFGEQQRVIDIRKTIFERNQNLFNKEDERLFNKQQNKLNNDLTQARAEFQSLQTAKIDALKMAQTNNAPVDVLQAIQSATSPEGVLQAGGKYAASDLLQRRLLTEQINQIGFDRVMAQARLDMEERRVALSEIQYDDSKTKAENEALIKELKAAQGILEPEEISAIDSSPQGKSLNALSELKLVLNEYQSLVNDVGVEIFGSDADRLDAVYSRLLTTYNKAAGLGALAGADLDLLNKAIPNADVGLIGGTIGNIGGYRTNKIKNTLEQLQMGINTAASSQQEQLFAKDPKYQNAQYVKALTMPFGDELITTSEVDEMDATLGGGQ